MRIVNAMKKIFKPGYLRSERGAAAIEAVLIFPFLFIVYFGLQDLMSLINFNRRITSTSSTISDTIAQYKTTVTRANITDLFYSVGLIMQPTPSTNVRVNVYGYYLNNNTPTIRWQVNNGTTLTCTAPDTTNFKTLMNTGNDLIVAVTCMTYTPWVAQFMGTNVLSSTSFLLNQTITTRPRASATLTCVTVAGGSTPCTT